MSNTLWQRNRAAVWALNGLSRHRGGHGPPPIGTVRHINGFTLVVSKANRPFGRSVFHRRYGKTTHLADRVTLIWKDGMCLGGQARWLCGTLTESFVLTHEQEFKLCVQCALRTGSVRIEINICPPDAVA